MDLQQKAEKFHAMGANVLPIKEGKKPAIDWNRLQTEKQSVEEMVSYDWKNCTGIGIVCGPGNFACIDIDRIVDFNITKTILAILELPEEYPWQVRSGSGNGYHVWVRINEKLHFSKGVIFGNSKDESFDHLEVRWKDCQTIVPPSMHKSGNRYQWVYAEPTDAPVEIEVSTVIEMFEKVAVLRAAEEKKEKPQYKKTEYTEIIQNGVDEGQRNDTLTKMTGHLRRMGMSYSETLQWLNLLNTARMQTPLPEAEITATIESIYSYPSEEMILHNGMELSLMEMPILNDIVDGIIGEKSFNFLAGEEGSGKSLLAMNLGIAVATGMEKFLQYDIKKHGKVLYLNNELSFDVFVKRFKTMRAALDKRYLRELDNFIVPESVKPLKDSWEDIVKILKRENPELVVLDCLYWAHDRKENDSSEMKDLMRLLVSLRDVHGLAVLVVHHTKKGVRYEGMHNDNMRGSQVFSASSDSNVMIRRSIQNPAQRLIKPTKLRNGSDESQRVRLIELNSHNLWFNDMGEVNEEDHIAAQGGSGNKKDAEIDWSVIFGTDKVLSRKEIIERCKRVGIEERTVDRRLKEGVDVHGTLTKPKNGSYEIVQKALPTSDASLFEEAF